MALWQQHRTNVRHVDLRKCTAGLAKQAAESWLDAPLACWSAGPPGTFDHKPAQPRLQSNCGAERAQPWQELRSKTGVGSLPLRQAAILGEFKQCAGATQATWPALMSKSAYVSICLRG